MDCLNSTEELYNLVQQVRYAYRQLSSPNPLEEKLLQKLHDDNEEMLKGLSKEYIASMPEGNRQYLLIVWKRLLRNVE